MNRAIVQCWDKNHEALVNATHPAVYGWCVLNGWTHTVCWDQGGNDYDHNYRKYVHIKEALQTPGIDEVLYLDNDIVPVSVKPAHFDGAGSVQISMDNFGYCAGAMLWRKGWGTWFLDVALGLLPKRGRYHLDEQDTLTTLLRLPAAKEHVRIIPENVVACPCSPKSLDPVFLHLWASSGYEDVVRNAEARAHAFLYGGNGS